MTAPFRYATQVGVADTTCFGTVCFTRYFDWQAQAQEAFFRAVLPTFRKLLDEGYQLLTVKASMRYRAPLRRSDSLSITVEVLTLNRTGLELLLTFFRSETEPIGVGRQRLLLTDWRGKPLTMPDDVYQRLRAQGTAADAATDA